MIVTASGGTAPYTYTYTVSGTYNWTQNTGNFQNLQGGSYVITVTDATGLSTTTNINLPNTYPPPHVDVASSTPPSTCIGSDGDITLAGSGGTPPYQYSINGVDFQTSPFFPNLSQGLYGTFVRDANGCVYGYSASFSLMLLNGNCYNKMSLQSVSIYSCNSNGSIFLGTPFAGTPPYQYSLDGTNYQSSNTFNNLSAGYHTIYFMDATGLTNIFSVYMIAACPLNISFLEVDASCQQNDGALTATVINGTPPYSFSLDGVSFQASNTFTGLAAGNYSITVKDLNGATFSETTTVYNKCPTLTLAETDETCGQKDGTITATGNKGTTPYQFSIDGVNFQISNIFPGLASGPYTVTLKDANGFTSSATKAINNDCLQINGSIGNTTCGNNNGVITATAQNGTAPYQFAIDGGIFQVNNLFTGLAAGPHTIAAMDANGLSASTILIVIDAPGPQINITTIQASCNNSNGVIQINATNGTAPLTFSIDDGITNQSTSVFNSLDSGKYPVKVKDANGCMVTSTVRLTALPTPVFSIGNDTTICAGQTLLLSTPPSVGYQYLWQDNSNNNSYLVSGAGLYTLSISNSSGCSSSRTVNVNVSPLPVFSIGNDTTLCSGKSLIIIPQPNVPGSYLWNDGSSKTSLTANTAGAYWLRITSNGCARQKNLNITYKPSPQINFGPDTTLCEGQSLMLNANNNNSIYSWQDGSAQPTFTVSQPGTYSVNVSENGCDASGSINVGYTTKPQLNSWTDTTICIT